MTKVVEEFTKFINEVSEWQDQTFPGANSLSKLAHLIEEIGELKDVIVYTPYDNQAMRIEYADCFLLLFGAAAKSGLSLADVYEAMKGKMEINKKRTWGTPDENGVVRHVKSNQV